MTVTQAETQSETLALLDDLIRAGVKLWTQDGRLFVNVEGSVLTDDLRARIKARREDLIAVLSAPAAPAPQSAAVPDDPVLTLAQEALLPMARAHAADARYHVPFALLVDGPVDVFRLLDAQNVMQDRHDALRQCFPADGGTLRLRPRGARLGWDAVIDLPAFDGTADDLPPAATAALRDFLARPFDLEDGPLWRAMVLTFANGRALVAWVFHHLILDGFSRDAFLSELTQIDRELAAGAEVSRQIRGWQIGAFAQHERDCVTGAHGKAAQAWWQQRLDAPWPATALPSRPDSAEESESGWHRLTLSPDLGAAMRARAHEARLPVGALAIAAACLALRSLTAQDKILLCTPVLNRDRIEAATTLGYLSRVLPLPVDIRGADTVADVAGQVAQTLLGANDHRFLPGSALFGQPSLRRCPTNRFMVGWQERAAPRAVQGFAATPVALERPANDFDLSLQFEADKSDISLRMDWAAGTLDAASARWLGQALDRALVAVAGAGWSMPVDAVIAPAVTAARVAEALAEDPSVNEAAAVATPDVGGIFACLTLNEDHRAGLPDLMQTLRARLGAALPPIRLKSRPVLPRDGAGQVDMRALQDMAAQDDPPAPEDLPCTEMERAIAKIWQSLLLLDRPIGRDEDFRDLGGHSLLAVRMWADVTALTGRRLPPSALVQARTIRHLAQVATTAEEAPPSDDAAQTGGLAPDIVDALRRYTGIWQGVRHRPDSIIVGRQTDGPRVPLFWCLQNETELDQIALHLGADQPVYGLRSGHKVMVKSPDNIRKLAAMYAAEIAELHADGPMFIGGNCQAAVIAFQLAQHLRLAGREIALLVLHEKMVPERYDGDVLLSFGRESDRNPFKGSLNPHAEFATYYTGRFSIELVGGKHGQFFVEPHVHEFSAMIRRARDATPALSTLNIPSNRTQAGSK